jgi:hypothetical protein
MINPRYSKMGKERGNKRGLFLKREFEMKRKQRIEAYVYSLEGVRIKMVGFIAPSISTSISKSKTRMIIPEILQLLSGP